MYQQNTIWQKKRALDFFIFWLSFLEIRKKSNATTLIVDDKVRTVLFGGGWGLHIKLLREFRAEAGFTVLQQ